MKIRFRIIHLFLLTTLVAIGCGWVSCQQQRFYQELATIEDLKSRFNASVSRQNPDYSEQPVWDITQCIHGRLYRPITNVSMGKEVDQSIWQSLKGFRYLETLSAQYCSIPESVSLDEVPHRHLKNIEFDGASLSSSHIRQMAKFPKVEELQIHAFPLRDEDMQHIARMKSLTYLHIRPEHVTPSGLALLRNLPEVEKIFIFDAHLTPAHVDELLKLKRLKYLSIERTFMDDASVERLNKISGMEFHIHNPPESMYHLFMEEKRDERNGV